MSPIHLSKRLAHLAAFNNDGRRIADIGTDHAYIPIYLAQTGQIDYAVASDIGAGPVAIAKANIHAAGLDDQIVVRQADGLAGLTAEDALDTIYIAGMGGQLIEEILEAGRSRLDGTETLILGPNRDAEALRRYLAAHEFSILDEDLVEDAGHVYPLMSVGQTRPQVPYTEADLMLGPVLRRKRTALFLNQLEIEIDKTEAVLRGLGNATQVPEAKMADEQARLDLLKEEFHAERK
ncbi:tRNA (adenine(22)-N(1))-methyltransferase [Lacticaseibacillus camelliae]|uniref:SAM-dependent methyltransferase n=1 Tax=Lacticaseibacillus camelliae DSM 22697 = JCM 13995 TaxID=1423730 RepID=A0A0R2F0L6_9LACO|nr:class I SAM-dependent methyltransferase [Lacticaseibacillus camelliae]KRN22178.1 SAM-dependent methyltransferase [Lacticaseibacillus camelliae DSM 22697 = JCM 13995]